MTRRRMILGAALCGSLALTAAGSANANSRYPLAQRLRALSPQKLVMAGTYGLLHSPDRGKTWYYVCERTLFGRAPDPLTFVDPLFELFSNGAITSGSNRMVQTSHDTGCTWKPEQALPVDPTWLDDTKLLNDKGLTIDLSLIQAKGDKAISALVTLNDAKGLPKEHLIYESLDTASTWQPLGKAISATEINSVTTHDFAPKDAKRIYVTGVKSDSMGNDSFKLAVSKDAGQTWEISDLPVMSGADDPARAAYIAGVTNNPDEIYVRVWRRRDEEMRYEDSLHYSNDAGKTWKEVLRSNGNLLGFALSPDYQSVLAGYGDPHISPIIVDDSEMGIFKAKVGENIFEKIVPNLPVSCLTWTADGVYVCANEYDPSGGDSRVKVDYHVGFTKDINSVKKKEDLEELLKLRNIVGPPSWVDGKENQCWKDWALGDPPDPQNPFGTCFKFFGCAERQIPNPPDVNGPFACGRPNAGGAGGAGGTGAGGHAGSTGAAGKGGGTSTSSCSYEVLGVRANSTGVLAAALGLLFAVGLRRRRA